MPRQIKSPPVSFGPVLKRLREEKGYGLREFAKLVDISPGYLSQLENNVSIGIPAEEKLRLIAQKLGMDAAQLMAWAGKLSWPIEVAAIACIVRGNITEKDMIDFLNSK